jgi:hypothetical protein
MELRTQVKSGSKKKWTLEELRVGFEKYREDNGRYPTGPEVNTYEYLPSSRSIERTHGGMVALRKTLGLSGQDDFRTGAHSTARAHMIGTRANATEKKVYDYLCERFGKEFVHREYFFTDDARTRADFFVYDNDENFCVDVFYPSDYRNLTNCLNSKQLKYTPERMKLYPVIFLQMNSEITQEELDRLKKNKTNQLLTSQYLMGWKAFEQFCQGRKPRQFL